jgi:hypothetical protein
MAKPKPKVNLSRPIPAQSDDFSALFSAEDAVEQASGLQLLALRWTPSAPTQGSRAPPSWMKPSANWPNPSNKTASSNPSKSPRYAQANT